MQSAHFDITGLLLVLSQHHLFMHACFPSAQPDQISQIQPLKGLLERDLITIWLGLYFLFVQEII